MLVVLILETKEAVDNLDQIAAVPGVDVLNLGPWDLSLSLGLDPRELPHSEIDTITDRAVELSRQHDIVVGAGCGSPEDVQPLLARGVRFISYGPDYGLAGQCCEGGHRRIPTGFVSKSIRRVDMSSWRRSTQAFRYVGLKPHAKGKQSPLNRAASIIDRPLFSENSCHPGTLLGRGPF